MPRALLGTPDRGYQEVLAKSAVADGLTVRAVEDLVREHNEGPAAIGGRGLTGVPGTAGLEAVEDGGQPAPDGSPTAPTGPRRLPPPGILELEELLSSHLNTRVKVDLSSKRGKVVVEFATLEDLERIYKLMVGGTEVAGV